MNTEAIPAIISEEIFKKCQKRLQQNKKMPAKFRSVDEKYSAASVLPLCQE